MKVFGVFVCVAYEGETLSGLFTTIEAANAHAAKESEQQTSLYRQVGPNTWTGDTSVEIRELEVQE